MLELLEMQSTPSLPSLPAPLWPEVVVPDRVLSMGQIELNYVLMLNRIVWNRTVFACWTGLFEMKLYFDIEIVYLCKTELFEIELFLTLKLCS